MGSSIQMYAATVPANSVASIDIPQDGELESVFWAAGMVTGADVDQTWQLSFASVIQAVNDARNVISSIRLIHDFTTSGAAMAAVNQLDLLSGIPVAAGERVYLHGSGTATAATIHLNLHFSFNEPSRAGGGRRR